MALSQGSPALWSDIKTVMTNISAARAKMGYSTTTIDALNSGTTPNPIQAATAKTLYDQINECRNRSEASSNSTVQNNLANAAPPSVGDLITIKQMTAINNMANAIKALNFAFFSGCFGFSDFSFSFGYYGSGFGYWA